MKVKLWVVHDESAISEISSVLAGKAIYIADGHHRYKTALRYQEEQIAARSSYNGEEPFNFVMMSLMDYQDPGIVMLPTHRLVRGLEPHKVSQLVESILPYFCVDYLLPPSITSTDTVRYWLQTLETRRKGNSLLGLYGLHGQNLCLLRLRPDVDLKNLMNEEELRLWRDIDVVLLHRIILQAVLGLNTTEEERDHIEYIRSGQEAKDKVDGGEYQIAFFLNQATVLDIINTADAGRILPRKSTNFYPKTPAGLVINPVWDKDD